MYQVCRVQIQKDLISDLMEFLSNLYPEPEFVNLLRRPGFDSQLGGPLRQPCLTYQPAKLHRLAESIPWNR